MKMSGPMAPLVLHLMQQQLASQTVEHPALAGNAPPRQTAKLSKHAHSAFAMQLRWKLTDQFGWEFQKFDRPGALP